MIILGLILLLLGFFLKIQLLWILGVILLIVGVVLIILGSTGRAVGGRKHYYYEGKAGVGARGTCGFPARRPPSVTYDLGVHDMVGDACSGSGRHGPRHRVRRGPRGDRARTAVGARRPPRRAGRPRRTRGAARRPAEQLLIRDPRIDLRCSARRGRRPPGRRGAASNTDGAPSGGRGRGGRTSRAGRAGARPVAARPCRACPSWQPVHSRTSGTPRRAWDQRNDVTRWLPP